MHRSTEEFWRRYQQLPQDARDRADKAFALLVGNARHPSLYFKKVGAYWSARVDKGIRALAVEDGEDFLWVWIGPHDEYKRIIGTGGN